MQQISSLEESLNYIGSGDPYLDFSHMIKEPIEVAQASIAKLAPPNSSQLSNCQQSGAHVQSEQCQTVNGSD